MLKALTLRDVRSMVVRMLLFAMAASLLGVFHAPVTHASDPAATPPCYDIAGKGKQVLVNGVPNAGVVDFDAADFGGNHLYQYEACVIDPSGAGTGTFELRGWAWDDNLGWISFYCGNEGLGLNTNLGQACGSFTYGVTVDSATGKFSNYAWGDNVGWIKFDNTGSPGNPRMNVDITTPVCQGYVYSVKAGCPAHSKADTVAWSDNVGWLDFDGIVLPWYTLVKEIVPAGITVTLKTDGGLDPSVVKKDGTSPVANGLDKYTLKVHIQDKKGNPVDSGGRYTVALTPTWVDTVKRDQTNTGVAMPPYLCPTVVAGAVNKPCTLPSVGGGDYSAPVTSVAPTSNMNFWDKNGNGVYDALDDFYYESFSAPATLAPSQSNQLNLSSVNISVYDNDAAACAYGTGVTCNSIANTPTYVNPADTSIKFRPRTEVTTLQDPSYNDRSINITWGSVLDFPQTLVGTDAVAFTSGIDPVPGSGNYNFEFDLNVDNKLDYPADGDGTSFPVLGANSNPLKLGVGVQKDVDGNYLPPLPPAYIPGEYVYTVVTDASNSVKYYSNKLPKVTGSLAVQPVVILRGNVYSSGATASTSYQAVSSLGDVSTNMLRDAIFRNVSTIIAGSAKKSPTNIVLDTDGAGGFRLFGGTSDPDKLTPLLPDDLGEAKVYLHYGNLNLGDSLPANPWPNIPWKGERTIIVIGGSVHINANLVGMPPGSGEAKPKLGIIVLKDLTALSADRKLQGNVYIGPKVQHIQANIFADGSVFPENANGSLDSTSGEPTFASVTDMQNQLKYYQLMIEGSVASQNTIGGAVKMITGTGAAATGDVQSRLYDLNFLRSYVGWVQRDASGNAQCPSGVDPSLPGSYVKSDGTPNTVYEPDTGCLYSPVTDNPGDGTYYSVFTDPNDQKFNLGATYIYFDPPPATLPGFGAQSGGTQKQLPQ